MKPILKKLIPTNPTYEQLQVVADGIAETVLDKHKKKPDYIIGVSRGGLISAVRISHLLRVPMVPVAYSSKNGAGDNKDHANSLPEFKNNIILIVDDISDSGHTLKELVDHYTKLGTKVETAIFYYKDKSVHEPTYYGYLIDDDFGWVNFPWEE